MLDHIILIDKLQERINADLQVNYSGDWYSDEGFDEKNTAVYQSATVTKMTFKDDSSLHYQHI